MFRKYEKTYRIRVPEYNVPGKLYLSKDELKHLLSGRVTIEEKLDGANTGIIRHKSGFHLQKRGSLVAQSEHAQFGYFHAWANRDAYDSIMSLPKGILVYGELMYCVHSIYYDRLPSYFVVFDVLHKGKFYNRRRKEEFCEEHGFAITPLIYEGFVTVEDLYRLMPEKSAFGDFAEGIVVKRYSKKEYIKGKVVKPEFIKRMENALHWSKKHVKLNKLA